MTTIQKATDSSTNQGVAQATSTQTAETEKQGESDFDVTLKGFITPNSANKVSEEALFSALVKERIQSEQGDEGLKAFQEILGNQISKNTKADGFVAIEDATKAALVEFRQAGKLDEATTNKIYSEAFAAAQLDDNEDALFDDRGGTGDTTIAVSTLEQALLASRVKIEKYDSGELTATERMVDEASVGKSAFATSTAASSHTSEGAGGFLFKPVSDSDGKLAVLLPSNYAGLAQSMRLLSPSGEEIETGRYAGNGNGNREHFRFSQPGQNYPAGVIVEATLTTGEKVRYTISNPSERTENLEADTDENDSNAAS